MKNTLLLIIATFTVTFSFAQTVTTKFDCHLITDKIKLEQSLPLPITETSIGVIPKGTEVPVLGLDTAQHKLVRVQYKKQTGWIHRNMVVDKSIFIENNPNVRDGYADAVRNRKVIYGMNEEEKELAIGIQNKSNESQITEDAKMRVGFDLGYSTGNYMIFDGSISKGLWYYGFSAQINTKKGTRGKSYDRTLGWNTDLDGVSSSGSFYDGAYSFDLGYYFKKNLCFGGGVGYAPHKLYRNFHDNTEILSESGWYYVTKGDGGKIDAKAFIHYYFKEGLLGRCYLRGQYSIIGGAGACIGFQL